MSIIIVIPARYDSKRLPGKVLLKETGKTVLEHTWDQTNKNTHRLIATDDRRIWHECQRFLSFWPVAVAAVMTSKKHPTGTDRVAEAVRNLPYDLVVNVQADEPEIDPASIDKLIAEMEQTGAEMGTLGATKIPANNLGQVKVAVDDAGFASYFTRSQVDGTEKIKILKHIGVYAYRHETLMRIADMEQTLGETMHSLEQLRALNNGIKIRVVEVPESHQGIDTREDYDAFVKRWGEKHA